jgi:hypothetical protein
MSVMERARMDHDLLYVLPQLNTPEPLRNTRSRPMLKSEPIDYSSITKIDLKRTTETPLPIFEQPAQLRTELLDIINKQQTILPTPKFEFKAKDHQVIDLSQKSNLLRPTGEKTRTKHPHYDDDLVFNGYVPPLSWIRRALRDRKK